jgi:hypothetical protein
MSRRACLGRDRLLIHREFVPSREQLGFLAFAFAQALPVIRKPLPRPAKPEIGENSNVNTVSYSSVSGALR